MIDSLISQGGGLGGSMRLNAENLACIRGGRTLYDGLSFSAAAGEAVLVTGPNGSGKTSLLRQIAGLLRRDRGEITLGETDAAEHIHFIGHANATKLALSVAENLKFWRDVYSGAEAPIDEALQRLGLGALGALPAGVLSAGQRRRLALAKLLVVKRPLWLLDEPDAALDREGRDTLAALISHHRDGGGIAIVTSHGGLDVSPTRELKLGTAQQAAA